ncbi:MAG: AI-2E family transporter, partial [Paracoccaceae bacterium]
AIAYFLDPVADRLEAAGFTRISATAIIFIGLLLIILPAVLLAIVVLSNQIQGLLNLTIDAERVASIESSIRSILPTRLAAQFDLVEALRNLGEFIGDRAAAFFQNFGSQLFGALMTSAGSIVNIAMLFVIAPIVAVYLLLDWDNMIARINDLIPRDHAPVVRRLAGDIDATLSAFVRGMGSVCLILGIYYAVALMAVGLNFGLVVGLVAGLVTFIPYVGALVGGALALGLGLFQFWGDWSSLAIVAGIFFAGQMIEGNYLTPKLVGSSVGLHPVWLLLALSVFGALFGFIGMLIAVPLAATLGVLARFVTAQYLDSRLYRGLSGKE